jgi:hypothetical protein
VKKGADLRKFPERGNPIWPSARLRSESKEYIAGGHRFESQSSEGEAAKEL